MSALHTLARAVLHAAAALTPKSCAGWTQAMQAEFETLDNGVAALEWALGCLAVAVGWRARADAVYLIILTATVAAFGWVAYQWLTAPPPGPPHIFKAWGQGLLVLGLTLGCLGGGAMLTGWRPKADWAYLAALAAALIGAHWLDWGIWTLVPDPASEQFFTLAHVSSYVSLGLPCLLLCAWRPGRIVLTVAMVLVINGDMLGGGATFFPPMLADPFTSKGNHPEIPNILMLLLFAWNMFGAAVVGAAAGWVLGRLHERLQRPAV